MSSPFTVFRPSNVWIDCEVCHRQVNMNRAGGCSRCRRMLCNDDLHGSFVRRLLVDLGLAPLVCVECRRKAAGASE